MYYTIYKITNKINDKIYVGMHKTNDLDDGYYGSGKRIKLAIEKYGIENFTKEYISIVDEEAEMIELERIIVNDEFINRDDTYNIQLGGGGGWNVVNDNDLKSYKQCKSLGEKLGKLHIDRLKSDPEYAERHRINASNNAKILWKIGKWKHCDWTGKKHFEESKRKMSEASREIRKGNKNGHFGHCWIHNLEIKKSKSIPIDQLDDYISDGWIKGRKMKF